MYQKKFSEKFLLPINLDQVTFHKSNSKYSLYHIKIPRVTDEHRSICGFNLDRTYEVNEPEQIFDICTKCLKGKYSYFEQDKPFDPKIWVDYFNDLTLEDNLEDSFTFDIEKMIQRHLDYEILSQNAQKEISKCNHVYLVYVMRYNQLSQLECHNCQKEISMLDCICDDPLTIDFVDTNNDGVEVNRDAFCLRCNGYLLRNVSKYK